MENMDNHEQGELFTVPEAARFLGVSESTLRNWRWRGTGPPSGKLVGGVRYRKADLRRWLAREVFGGVQED